MLTTTTHTTVIIGITITDGDICIGRCMLSDWLTADNSALLDRYITKDSRTSYNDYSGGWGRETVNRRARGGV